MFEHLIMIRRWRIFFLNTDEEDDTDLHGFLLSEFGYVGLNERMDLLKYNPIHPNSDNYQIRLRRMFCPEWHEGIRNPVNPDSDK